MNTFFKHTFWFLLLSIALNSNSQDMYFANNDSNIASFGISSSSLSKTTIDQFIGTNAFIDDPLDKMQAVGYIREYHPWNWDEGEIQASTKDYAKFPNNKNAFNPSAAAGGNYWFFDAYYKKLTDAGLMVCPAVMGSVKWLNDANNFGADNIPVKAGLDRNAASSYKEHADHLFQYAARYGSTIVHDSLLKLADNQARVSGLGYLKYIENWNEPDRWWGNSDENFTAENVAAMGSADRDGHCGEMGLTFGVKNADPKIKLVMGGLSLINTKYIDNIRKWCIANRKDKSFAYDVINVHNYCNTSSPEKAKIKETILALVKYRDTNLPGVEIWMTEFGWDSGINTTSYSSLPISGYSREEVQAQWIIREYLLLSSTGIDRAAQFMLRNVSDNGKTSFETCGLTSKQGTWNPKPSWYYTYTMKNTLKGKYFSSEIASGNPNVSIYTYENKTRDSLVYAIWAPTSNGTIVKDFNLNLLAGTSSAKLIELTNSSKTGTISSLTINSNSVAIEVSERPVFVVTMRDTSVIVKNNKSKTFNVQLFPNPVTNKLNIEISGVLPLSNSQLKIYNHLGICQFNKHLINNQLQLDVSSLKNGLYIAQIENNSGIMFKKFMK